VSGHEGFSLARGIGSGQGDGDAAAFGRIRAALAESLGQLAEEMEPTAWGWVVRTRSLARVWTLNQMLVRAPVEAEELAGLAETHQGDLGYRHVVVEDDAVAAALAPALQARGWQMDREVIMALAEEPDRRVETGAVEVIGEQEMLGLMQRWLREERPETSARGVEEVAEYNRREGRLWGETSFGVRQGGEAVAVTKGRGRHGIGWVEDVYTVPEARGRGYARALVTHATDRAREGNDLTFIVADENDWPRTLYGKIGFRPVGWMRTFHRR